MGYISRVRLARQFTPEETAQLKAIRERTQSRFSDLYAYTGAALTAGFVEKIQKDHEIHKRLIEQRRKRIREALLNKNFIDYIK